jgi:fibronectin type 3 domain-containing protein
MKKSTLLLWTLSLLTFNGCGGIKALTAYKIDDSLKSINSVKALPARSSVGFEWEKIKDKRVQGVNIYRGKATEGRQSLKHIGTVGNPYGTHFVDRRVKPNTSYIYTFTTLSLGRESRHGSILKVKTAPALKGLNFFQAYRVAPSVIKLLWSPHSNESISRYVIERSVNGGPWRFIANVKGRLMVEYIDTFIKRGNSYRYRIFAKSFDKVLTKPTQTSTLSM